MFKQFLCCLKYFLTNTILGKKGKRKLSFKLKMFSIGFDSIFTREIEATTTTTLPPPPPPTTTTTTTTAAAATTTTAPIGVVTSCTNIGGNNLALNQPATQSATYLSYYPERAFDGSSSTYSATPRASLSWLKVQLATLSNITRVNLLPQLDITNGIITIARSSDMTQQAVNFMNVASLGSGICMSYPCQGGVLGTFVQISITNGALLAIREMKVIGFPV
ncbi:uncharacterized protein LOC130629011 [Hydractinia symbiolongicarpus]|uniref:uncharacterized protein LOC130629011 n=1 Tax=Hydractinia symbiolongicarpus TaxID=13093 RepID=UPI00254E045C|nr:uncharacterized protein LOC130629011 [Hydractinia symbiolongicarpus]